MSPETDEQQWIERCRAGDASGFDELVRRHAPWATRFAARMAGPQAAEDVAQEAFVRAFRALADFRGESGFRTYLYRILLNVARDLGSRRRREEEALERLAQAEDRPLSESADARLERRELRSEIAAAIERLPRAQRETIILRVHENLSYREIAELLGVTPHAVKWNLAAAREKLAVSLGALTESNEVEP